MHKNYYICALFFVLCGLTISCKTTSKVPMKSIQLELLKDSISTAEKYRGIENLQKRIVSLGAENVVIAAQNNQKITFNYQGDIKLEAFEKAFMVSGKLEFFEVCLEKEVLAKTLLNLHYKVSGKDSITSDRIDYKEDNDTFFGMSFAELGSVFLGTISEENKEKIIPLLKKASIYVAEQKKYIKFLLGRKDEKDRYEVYAVYVNKDGKPTLDGSYVVAVATEKSPYNDSYNVNIEMDEVGAKIWEELTTHVYYTRGNIAVAVDNEVYMAPTVSSGGISGGFSQISANLNEEEASMLANAIRLGAIPKVKIISVSTLKPY